MHNKTATSGSAPKIIPNDHRINKYLYLHNYLVTKPLCRLKLYCFSSYQLYDGLLGIHFYLMSPYFKPITILESTQDKILAPYRKLVNCHVLAQISHNWDVYG
jgi:hypothetical protein